MSTVHRRSASVSSCSSFLSIHLCTLSPVVLKLASITTHLFEYLSGIFSHTIFLSTNFSSSCKNTLHRSDPEIRCCLAFSGLQLTFPSQLVQLMTLNLSDRFKYTEQPTRSEELFMIHMHECKPSRTPRVLDRQSRSYAKTYANDGDGVLGEFWALSRQDPKFP